MERDHLEEPGFDGRIILGLIFSQWDMGTWVESVCFRIRTVGGHL